MALLNYDNSGIEKVNSALLGVLNKKNRDIIERRFGLFSKKSKQTLEAIGGIYNITRERVRQIEEASLRKIKKSAEFSKNQKIIFAIKSEIDKRGGIVGESDFLRDFSEDKLKQNHLLFLLKLADDFSYLRADNKFKSLFTTNVSFTAKIKELLSDFGEKLEKENAVLKESEILERFGNLLKNKVDTIPSKAVLISWLNLTNFIKKNQFGEWGPASSIHISPRGSRDLAYLILRKENKPMHFQEIADKVAKTFSKKVHPQTVHNELIKHLDFVLVGRGIYGLRDWGYKQGTVKEVIAKILQEKGPLKQEEIVNEVLKERFVKKGTILVNLQNKNHFKRKGSYYHLA